MNNFLARIKYRFALWRYETFDPWFKEHKDHWFFRYFEEASWFKWYGKRVVYVKPKDVSELSDVERKVKKAIDAKDYETALELVNTLPFTPKTVALTQIIKAKLK